MKTLLIAVTLATLSGCAYREGRGKKSAQPPGVIARACAPR